MLIPIALILLGVIAGALIVLLCKVSIIFAELLLFYLILVVIFLNF